MSWSLGLVREFAGPFPAQTRHGSEDLPGTSKAVPDQQTGVKQVSQRRLQSTLRQAQLLGKVGRGDSPVGLGDGKHHVQSMDLAKEALRQFLPTCPFRIHVLPPGGLLRKSCNLYRVTGNWLRRMIRLHRENYKHVIHPSGASLDVYLRAEAEGAT